LAVHWNVSEFGFSIRCSYTDIEFSHIQSRADQECPFVVVRVQQVFSLGAGDWTMEPRTGIELGEWKRKIHLQLWNHLCNISNYVIFEMTSHMKKSRLN
jgi:hypothetical protein